MTPTLDPAGADPMADLVKQLDAWQSGSRAAASSLRLLRVEVEARERLLEGPQAALDFIDRFVHLFEQVGADLSLVRDAVPGGVQPEQGELLRRIAACTADEQSRVVAFRDKWINKPLPDEAVRPLLTTIATAVGNQLADYRALMLAASRLAAPSQAPAPTREAPSDERPGFDRRALFGRWLRGEDQGPGTTGS